MSVQPPMRFGGFVAVVLILACFRGDNAAQVRVPVDPPPASPGTSPILFATDAKLRRYLEAVAELIQEKDGEQAAEALQSVLDRPGDALVEMMRKVKRVRLGFPLTLPRPSLDDPVAARWIPNPTLLPYGRPLPALDLLEGGGELHGETLLPRSGGLLNRL